MRNFRLIDRDTDFLMPPSVDEWLPERHLARFVVEVIAGLDLWAMTGAYRGSGEASYHPRLLLGLIVLWVRHRRLLVGVASHRRFVSLDKFARDEARLGRPAPQTFSLIMAGRRRRLAA